MPQKLRVVHGQDFNLCPAVYRATSDAQEVFVLVLADSNECEEAMVIIPKTGVTRHMAGRGSVYEAFEAAVTELRRE